jgi:hypothetical protein
MVSVSVSRMRGWGNLHAPLPARRPLTISFSGEMVEGRFSFSLYAHLGVPRRDLWAGGCTKLRGREGKRGGDGGASP